MKRETKIRELNSLCIGCPGALVTVLMLLAHVSSTLAAEPSTGPNPISTTSAGAVGRETVEEAFASHAAQLTTDGESSGLSTSIEVAPQEARVVRLVIRRSNGGEPCLDELEVYGPDSQTNLALASRGAVARASSVLAGYAIHAVPHLNDGLYGNSHSWIAATAKEEWAEVELPAPAKIARVVISRDRNAQFMDRQILEAEVQLSSDGQTWQTAGTLTRPVGQLSRPLPSLTFPIAELPEPTWASAVNYAFLRERDTWSRMDAQDFLSPLMHDRPAAPGGQPYWGHLARLAPLERVFFQFEELLERLAALGLDVDRERDGTGCVPPAGTGPDRRSCGCPVSCRAASQASALLPRPEARAARTRALRQTPSARTFA